MLKPAYPGPRGSRHDAASATSAWRAGGEGRQVGHFAIVLYHTQLADHDNVVITGSSGV
jgi:hypothetical protein